MDLEDDRLECTTLPAPAHLTTTHSQGRITVKSLLIGISLAAWLISCASTSGQELTPQSLDKLKAALRDKINAGEIEGAVHLVVHSGKTVFLDAAGHCDLADQKPFQPDTIVRIYSMSKPITSVAAMTLYEQGKFQLDDPVARYIPAFDKTTVLETNGDQVKPVPPKRPITVRDVLRHTTGFSYGDEPQVREYYEREGMRYWGPSEMFPPRMNVEQAAEALARIPALHHPGERFTYGFNTDLLGRLIEIWSGMPLDRYLSRAVLEPLEMEDTGFSIPPHKRDRFASCYATHDGKLVLRDKAAGSLFSVGCEFLSGGGGLVSTMQDYANFCQMLVDGGVFKSRRILQPDTLKLMFTDQLNGVASLFQFGLGFEIAQVTLGTGDAGRTVAQYSWGGYASTEFCVIPEVQLFQIFVRQHVPSLPEFAKSQFTAVRQQWNSGNDTAKPQ